MAHLPLWTIYEEWGWGTADAGRALGYLKRFGSVTDAAHGKPARQPKAVAAGLEGNRNPRDRKPTRKQT
jgi:hypothetical protein